MGVREIISGMDPDLLVQEVMYGSIMALTFVITAQFDVLAYNDRTELAIAIIAMDFVWAVIDLLLFYRSDLVGMARRAKLSRKLHSGDDRGELRADIEAEFEGTFLDMTDDETRREVIDKIMMSGPPDNPHNLASVSKRRYRKSAIGSFIAAVFPAFPPSICLLIISDYDTSLFAASLSINIIMFYVGIMASPYSRLSRRILTGLVIVGLGFLLTVFAAVCGG